MGKLKPKVPYLPTSQRAKTAKWLSLLLVLTYFLHGLVCLSVSIWMELHNVRQCDFLDNMFAPVHILLCSGCLAVFACGVSIVYACRFGKNAYVRTFTAILFLVVSFEVLTAIVATVRQRSLNNSDFHESMRESLHKPGKKSEKCWKNIQSKYTCCGFNGYEDWLNETSLNSTSYLGKPGSEEVTTNAHNPKADTCLCGSETTVSECIEISNDFSVFKSGCYLTVRNKLNDFFVVLRILGPCLAVLQIVSSLTLCCVFAKLQKKAVVAIYQVKDGKVPEKVTLHYAGTTTPTDNVRSRDTTVTMVSQCNVQEHETCDPIMLSNSVT